PQANSISLLLRNSARGSRRKSNPSSCQRQTFRPPRSASLNSNLFFGAAPPTRNEKAYASGSPNVNSLRAPMNPPPPLKSKSSRSASPFVPGSLVSFSFACPEATASQLAASEKSSTIPFFIMGASAGEMHLQCPKVYTPPVPGGCSNDQPMVAEPI